MKLTHFQIEFTKERIIPSGGLTLVGHILENSGLIERLNKQDVTGRRSLTGVPPPEDGWDSPLHALHPFM